MRTVFSQTKGLKVLDVRTQKPWDFFWGVAASAEEVDKATPFVIMSEFKQISFEILTNPH